MNAGPDEPRGASEKCEDVLIEPPADLRVWAQRNGYAPVQLGDTKGSFVEFPVKGSIGGPMFVWREDARTEMLPWPEAVRRFGSAASIVRVRSPGGISATK